MRTRIALVAIPSIAVISITLLSQTVSAQPVHAVSRTSHRTSHATTVRSSHRSSDRLTALVTEDAPRTAGAGVPDLHIADLLLSGTPAGHKEVAPVVPPPPPVPVGPVDTVTPYQRAAWERVAMCEEGGDWHADGSRFSGGLGITRSNWAAYGGLQYASSAAYASEDEQIMVAERIQSSPPDQYGCSSW